MPNKKKIGLFNFSHNWTLHYQMGLADAGLEIFQNLRPSTLRTSLDNAVILRQAVHHFVFITSIPFCEYICFAYMITTALFCINIIQLPRMREDTIAAYSG